VVCVVCVCDLFTVPAQTKGLCQHRQKDCASTIVVGCAVTIVVHCPAVPALIYIGGGARVCVVFSGVVVGCIYI